MVLLVLDLAGVFPAVLAPWSPGRSGVASVSRLCGEVGGRTHSLLMKK